MAGENGCKRLLKLTDVHDLSKDPQQFAMRLGDWGVIPKQGEYPCPKCGKQMRISKDTNAADGVRWYCGNSNQKGHRKRTLCTHRVGLRTGTFFYRSRLSIYQIVGFVVLWLRHISLRFACEQLDISRKTAVDWASFCRAVCVDFFMTNKQKLGGEGKVVEIYESKFGKRKYHRGLYVEGQWVFGAYERGSGKVFMVPVNDRSPDVLLTIIQEWIESGTTIVSDFWRDYDCLSSVGYVHLKMDHSINFVAPETDAHTNAIESPWWGFKATICASGRSKKHSSGYLACYMFSRRCKEVNLDGTVEFLCVVGQLYNPLLPPFDILVEEENCTTDDSDFSD